jgi:hypothetical protein
MDDAKKAGAAATLCGVGLPLATVSVIQSIGFAATGVVAGSTAAGIQAGIGSVVAGSAFAIAQSIGALGSISAIAAVGGPLGVVGAAGYYTFRWLRNR